MIAVDAPATLEHSRSPIAPRREAIYPSSTRAVTSTSSTRPLLEARPLRISQATVQSSLQRPFSITPLRAIPLFLTRPVLYFSLTTRLLAARPSTSIGSLFYEFANNSTAANSTIAAAFDSSVTILGQLHCRQRVHRRRRWEQSRIRRHLHGGQREDRRHLCRLHFLFRLFPRWHSTD